MSTANPSSTAGAPVVALRGLTKRFGEVTAVDDLTYEVRPGRIVGLLGRNGAGKTTSLRMLLGLCRPTSGEATVFGRPYAELPHAARRVGVSMDAVGPLPGASARRELTIWARTLGLPRQRVEEVLDLVGLADGNAASRPVKGYSTGMKQRLALATALLPDPELLVLDEPANGLDPDGIRWLRGLLRGLADEGRTVLVSSHLLSEVEQTVDDVVIIQSSLRYAGPLDGLVGTGEGERLEDRFFSLVGSPTTASTAPAVSTVPAASFAVGGQSHA
ncbi:ABC transporter ATP-binding protein [Streptomyces stelliscabiei]|uniref:ABC-2 type transport system ATP-binding protein n=1 Tax=Streptomyces stelliscabiei TaxID=146820 RepID=A0A8I0P925_9ACTN|nr:ATP-binding cassette domain-containing protein [Streptomyces stelliscabiei]KND44258.1 ABC transporter ATP-binding protein [Streptomyces stelliscabiei]MBE1598396.1 ABC-2 type transport system ATP-binding protein [Streptomyces stelliscabiei]MDX2518784.1 ATP-binding cassette domain-containing protein [Streptomyces stelliscabiei]